MSTISDAMGLALTALSGVLGETLYYRASTGVTAAWTALPAGFILHRDEQAPPMYMEQQSGEAQTYSGALHGLLTPVMAVGYQIKDGNGDKWAVITADLDQQQICTVKRVELGNAGPDRGGAA